MYHRRLEIFNLKQDLSGFIGPRSVANEPGLIYKDLKLTENMFWWKLQDLVTDLNLLVSLYDTTIGIYEWYNHETNSDYKSGLASEQLQEAKESKATAISVGKLTNAAFLYLPINLVCALLGMNLSIYGQGDVPMWVFFALLISLLLLSTCLLLDQALIRGPHESTSLPFAWLGGLYLLVSGSSLSL